MSKDLVVKMENVQDALSSIEKNPTLTVTTKRLVKGLIMKIFGIEPKVFKPGDAIVISHLPSEVEERYLMCVTANAQNYRCIRFCSINDGQRAGDSMRPYQLPYDIEGMTADEIEGYLGSQYKVVDQL